MIETKLKEYGYEFKNLPKPLANYIPAIQINNLILTSGQVPLVDGEIKYKGKVGKNLTEEEGMKAAEICAFNCLSAINNLLGDINKIERIVKLTVFVNSADDFVNQPKIANGASDFIVNLFGEEGKHARSAVGVNGLPLNAAVEIEMIAKLK
ncbi:MAG: RidA family protein [Ignavibacteriales bacterium]|nr:RidA family protein [Ignavibacteriales bacterium]